MRSTLRVLADIAAKEGKELYIVGGFVRDALLGKQSRDLDFVVNEDADSFARRAAFLLRGSYDPLDSGAQHARIRLTADDGLPVVFDFSLRRGKNTVEDLRQRDFTVNAMAVSLQNYLHKEDWPEEIIDPCNGKEDLAAGLLRLTSEKSLHDDPVRLLRAARFLQKLDLKFAPGTLQILRRNAGLVRQALSNKLSVELFKLLSGRRTADSLRVLHEDIQVLAALYPPFAAMDASVADGEGLLTHGLRTCDYLETCLLDGQLFPPGLSASLLAHLRREIEPERPRLAYLKLACVLHDVGMIGSGSSSPYRRFFSHEVAGEPYVADFAKRLRFTAAERNFLSVLVCNHSRPFYIRTDEGISPPLQRFIYQFSDCAPELILLAMADQAVSKEKNLAQAPCFAAILELFFAGAAERLPRPLLTAEEVMDFFNLPPARPVGRLLEAAYAAQIEGRVSKRSDALSLISTLLEQGEQ